MKRIQKPELWLHLHPYALSFAVFDPESKKVVELEAKVLGQDASKSVTADMLGNWLNEHEPLLQLHFNRVLVAVHSPVFTILPEHSDDPRTVLETLGYTPGTDDRILEDVIAPDFILYYTLPRALAEFLEHRFSGIEWHFADLGSMRFQNAKLSFRNHLLANLYGDDLSLALKQGGKVTYFNKFNVKAKEDLLYYIRLAYDQLRLNPNEFSTYLYGYLEEKSPLYSTAFGYIRNFEIDRTLKHGLGYLHTDEHLPFHYYLNLLALGPCV